MVVFKNIERNGEFYYTGFETKQIDKTKFLKINILERDSNTSFSIYEIFTDEKLEDLSRMEVFTVLNEYLCVVYKNGRLKFSLLLD